VDAKKDNFIILEHRLFSVLAHSASAILINVVKTMVTERKSFK
jgi:hypothetical protein